MSSFKKLAFPSGPKEIGFSESSVYRITPDNFTGTPNPADNWGPTPPVEQPVSAPQTISESVHLDGSQKTTGKVASKSFSRTILQINRVLISPVSWG
jgi:hypothetical protein